jgi:phage tail sheath protein FI
VELEALVMGLISLGENLTSIPDGAPVDDRVTVEEKSPIGIRVSVASPDAPCATLIEFGAMERSKSAGGPEEVTINSNEQECV